MVERNTPIDIDIANESGLRSLARAISLYSWGILCCFGVL
jgi:hypothetical protein